MAEAADPCLDTEDEKDDLREDLQLVLTALKELKYDFTNVKTVVATYPQVKHCGQSYGVDVGRLGCARAVAPILMPGRPRDS